MNGWHSLAADPAANVVKEEAVQTTGEQNRENHAGWDSLAADPAANVVKEEEEAAAADAMPSPLFGDIPTNALRHILLDATNHKNLLQFLSVCARVAPEWWRIVRTSDGYGFRYLQTRCAERRSELQSLVGMLKAASPRLIRSNDMVSISAALKRVQKAPRRHERFLSIAHKSSQRRGLSVSGQSSVVCCDIADDFKNADAFTLTLGAALQALGPHRPLQPVDYIDWLQVQGVALTARGLSALLKGARNIEGLQLGLAFDPVELVDADECMAVLCEALPKLIWLKELRFGPCSGGIDDANVLMLTTALSQCQRLQSLRIPPPFIDWPGSRVTPEGRAVLHAAMQDIHQKNRQNNM